MAGSKKKAIIWTAAVMVIIYLAGSCLIPPAFHSDNYHPLPAHVQKDGVSERIRCIDDNTEALLWRLKVIESAQQELILSSYSFRDDEAGRDILAALYQAAERGVKVRLLVDGISGRSVWGGSRCFQALSGLENVEIRFYNPAALGKLWKINYRLHDKYLIADRQVYILGGRNMRNLSLGNYQEKQDIDRDVLVYSNASEESGSVDQLRMYFEKIWSSPDTVSAVLSKKTGAESAEVLKNHYIELKTRYPSAFLETDWRKETLPANRITLLSNPIHTGNKEPVIWDTICSMMNQGQDIMIQTPYMICSQKMYHDLSAIRQQGKTIRILTNSPETGANLCGCADYQNQKHKIRRTVSEVYEYAGQKSSHTKTVLIDDRISMIGSFNFDMRSAYLDTELMLVIDCPELNAALRNMNQDYIKQSRCILPDGTAVEGENYEKGRRSIPKQTLNTVLRILTVPFRYLL